MACLILIHKETTYTQHPGCSGKGFRCFRVIRVFGLSGFQALVFPGIVTHPLHFS